MEKPVQILLAAYKGEKYIRAMIDSILAQDCDDWRLILSDDGEDTAPVLQAYADAHPDKIIHYRSLQRFGSAQKHFMHLLRTFGQDAPYSMFCDQDDVWHPDKVRKTLALMRQTEGDTNLPVLVHTDLRVVDGQLQALAPSFLQYSSLDGNRLAWNQLLVQNVITGCTVMVNRSLARLADRDVPEQGMLMHDWWLGLLAATCGKCVFLPEATIDYRQHGNNTVGAKNSRSLGYILAKLRSGVRESMAATALQAGAFAESYADVLTAEQLALLREYSRCFADSKCRRLHLYVRYRLWKNGLHRRIGQVLWG